MPYSQSHQVGPIQSRPIIITGIICLKVYYHHHHMVWTFLGQLTCISPLFDIELLLTALVVNEKKKTLVRTIQLLLAFFIHHHQPGTVLFNNEKCAVIICK